MKPQELAKKTVETNVLEHKKITCNEKLEGLNQEKGAVFVSIKTKDDELRGCIGTFLPTKDTIEEEIIDNAISASTRDPRFPEVKESELSDLVYSVDVLTEPQSVTNIEELDPKKYGIIVQSTDGADRQGLLLPDLEGIDSIQDQVMIAKHKANIALQEPISIFKFEVQRFN